MARGDHFFVWRQHRGVPFQHHGVDLGDGTVVHFTDGGQGVAGPGGSSADFEIQRTPMENVSRDGRDPIHVIEHARSLRSDLVVRRALSQVGRGGYDLIFDNCEHFACWCVVGRQESRQVTTVCGRVAAAGTKAIAAGTLRTTSRFAMARAVRGASPWLLVADAAQWATEAGGHHVGLTDPSVRKRAGLALGGATALGIGTLGGAAGVAVAGGLWIAGELAGEASRRVYEQTRTWRQRSD